MPNFCLCDLCLCDALIILSIFALHAAQNHLVRSVENTLKLANIGIGNQTENLSPQLLAVLSHCSSRSLEGTCWLVGYLYNVVLQKVERRR